MPEVQCLKFQFEIRYTHILNFSTVIKEIISPFLKLASSFSIGNQGTPEESYRLDFEGDSFWIDCRWDRMIFLSERNIDRFKDENSPVQFFFKIAEKLTKRETFGVFTNYVLSVDFLKVLDDQFGKIKDDIKAKYLTSQTDDIIMNPDDIAITLQKNNKNKDITLSFGPFSQNDINERKLIPFKSPELTSAASSSGILLEIKIFEKTGEINFHLFKELLTLVNDYSKLI